MFKQVEKSDFINSRNRMPETLKVFITQYSAKEYTNMNTACFLSTDNKSGYALTEDKDLISVFSLNSKGVEVVKSAIQNGATTLDCIGDFLASYYSKFGFVESDRMTWNDDYAPENWDYEKFGKPDVIFMKLNKPP